MTANEAKLLLMEYYLAYSMPCMTEMELWGMYRADIVAIDQKKTFREVEIKVNKDDLIGELNSIDVLKKDKRPDKSCKKYLKHREYLQHTSKNYKYSSNSLIPNKFYFAVPEKLYDNTKKELGRVLKGTGYGLIFLPSQQYAIFQPRVIERPKNIHNRQISEDEIMKFLLRASRENFREMKKSN